MSAAQIILPVFTFIFNIFIAFTLLRSNRKNIVNQTFSLFIFTIGLWSLSSFLLNSSPSILTGMIRLTAGLTIGLEFALFAHVFPNSNEKSSFRFYFPIFALILIMEVGTVTKILFVGVSISSTGQVILKFGPLYPGFILIYIAFILPYG